MLTIMIAEGIAIALLAVLVVGLLRSHALILKALHDLGAGLDLEREASRDGTATAAGSGGAGPTHVDLETGVVASMRSDGARRENLTEVIGTTLDGQSRRVSLRDARTLLAFLTSGCHVCATFWEQFRGPLEIPGDAHLVVVVKDGSEESPTTVRRLAPAGLDVIVSGEAWADHEVPGSPYFVYVDHGRVIGEGSATTWPSVRSLMSQAVADASHS